jgi:tRNA G46 methylase TrmB
VRDLARALEPEGLVEVATDHPEYAAWIDEIFSDEPALENCRGAGWSSDVEDRPCTAYEAEWRAERRTLHFFSFARRPDVVAPPL